MVAYDNVLCAASSIASTLGNPIITPPSVMASSTKATNAGPDPASAVHASKCFSSMKRHLPHDEKMPRSISLCKGCEEGMVETTVIHFRICSREIMDGLKD